MNTIKKSKGKNTTKIPKPNGMFRKPIRQKVFDKKYLNAIGQGTDRLFMASCFRGSEGTFTLRPDLDRDTLLRLNKLAKVIKSNRGIVNSLWLGVVLVLVASVAIFGTFFMNPLIEEGVEAGLQAAFGARAEVDGLRLNPFRMSLSIAAIHVADYAAPMTNLFETGRVELELDPAALLRGKVYIREAAAEHISQGTPRATSGALPDSKKEKASPVIPVVPEPPLLDFKKFDAKALLEQEKAKLASTAAYTEVGTAYEEANARWLARVESSSQAVTTVEESGKNALAIDLASIKTVAQASSAIDITKNALASLQAVTVEANAIKADMDSDSKELASLAVSAKDAVTKDIAYLKSFVDPKSGSAMGALEPVIRNMLSAKGGHYLYLGQRGLSLLADFKEITNKLQDPKKAANKAAQKERKARLKGRTVYFQSTDYPLFRLGHLVSQFPVSGQAWEIELSELSSNPDLVGSPSSLMVKAKGDTYSLSLDAVADFRKDAAELYSVQASAGGIALDLKDAFSKVGLDGFSGNLDGVLDMQGKTESSMQASLGMTIVKPRVARATGTLAEAVAGAIDKTGSIEARATWVHTSREGSDSFSLSTNLDRIVREAMEAIAGQYAQKAANELEKVLRDFVSRELEGKLGSKEDFDSLFAMAKGDASALDNLKKSLDQKLKDIEAKARSAAEGAAAGAATSILEGLKIPKRP